VVVGQRITVEVRRQQRVTVEGLTVVDEGDPVGAVLLQGLDLDVGAGWGADVQVESLEQHSPYAVSFVNHRQALDRDTLLATHIDGEPLPDDHGYPLRLIGPGRPGVNQTKWVTRVVVL